MSKVCSSWVEKCFILFVAFSVACLPASQLAVDCLYKLLFDDSGKRSSRSGIVRLSSSCLTACL